MNKKELTKELSGRLSLTQKEAGQCISAIMDIISDVVRRGEAISLAGFGKFAIRYQSRRKYFNPRSGRAIIKSACRVPTFKVYSAFKTAVNN